MVLDCNLNFFIFGAYLGATEMRQYWKHYYKACQALVFVVDSASEMEELEKATRALEDALIHPDLQGVPCLIIANCEDKLGARNESQVTFKINTCLQRILVCRSTLYNVLYGVMWCNMCH